MPMISFKDYVTSIESSLKKMQVTDNQKQPIEKEEGLSHWCHLTHQVKQSNATMYFVGNGASAMMAGHMAADASKNGGFRSLAFNDAALMTAVSNDIAYQECFAMPLNRFADQDDVLVTISSSGNSPNVIRAIEVARNLNLTTITLSGMKADNRSRQMGNLNFYIPADTYGVIESTHQVLLHCWLDKYMQECN
jgi:D-sedoheptulose 7-phosphate isomerase